MSDSMIYIIDGKTGEFEDKIKWHVRAFTSKDAADKFCAMLNEWLRVNGAHWDCTPEQLDIASSSRGASCPYDPHFVCDYTGTKYEVSEVPLTGWPETGDKS